MKKILVVGSLNMDMNISVRNFPEPGETIFGKDLLVTPGGKGANQSYAIGKLGGTVQMIGCVGKDENGRKLLDNLSKVHVDVSNIQVLKTVSTGLAMIMKDEKGENTITVISGANYYLSKDLISEHLSLIENADFVLTQLETPIETVEYLAELCEKYEKKLILDPSPARMNLPEGILRNTYIMKPNETELSVLTGMSVQTKEEVIAATRVLTGKGVKNVVTTLGGRGTIWTNAEGSEFFSAKKVNTVDTTAAGDTFMAALLCRLCDNWDFRNAIRYATVASSITVTRRGAQQSIPDAVEIEKITGGLV